MDSSNRLWRVLGKVNFGLDVFILFFLLTAQWIEIPPFLQVFGRTHPMVLHFPIVFIFLLPAIPWLLSSLSIDKPKRAHIMGNYITIAHLLCAVTVLFGLFLSVENGYSGQVVINHKWGGIVLLLTLILLENTPLLAFKQNTYPQWSLFVPVVALVITSHIGSGITHGRDFLTEPIIKKTTQMVPLDQALVFRDVIHPILDQKCLNCHNSTKSKGELILEDSTSILLGGEDGVVVIPGNISESSLFQRLNVDIDHDDHMPPKGKPQLTQEEISIIGEWIEQGNLFDVSFSSLDPTDTLAILIRDNYQFDDRPVYDMKAADVEDIKALNDNYRLLIPVARESPALYARFLSSSHYEDTHLTALTKVQEQVVDLYLGNIPVEDADIATLGNFTNLQVLNLNGTGITDQGLSALYDLQDLQKLYLTGTSVTEEGLRKLLEINPIKKIYVWDTSIDSNRINTLEQQFPGTDLVGISNAFGNEIIALNSPQIDPDVPFFHTSSTITMEHPIPQVSIRYTTDGSVPDSLHSPLYTEALKISEDTELQIKAFKTGWLSSPVLKRSFYGSRYTPDSTWFITTPNENYMGEGAGTAINLKAGERVHEDKNYLAYRDSDGIIGFSFDETVPLKKIVVSTLIKTPSYIFPPVQVRVEILDDQGAWQDVGNVKPVQPTDQIDYVKGYISIPLNQEIQTKQVKLTLTPQSVLPAWHPGKGDRGWVFVDEVLFQ